MKTKSNLPEIDQETADIVVKNLLSIDFANIEKNLLIKFIKNMTNDELCHLDALLKVSEPHECFLETAFRLREVDENHLADVYEEMERQWWQNDI